MTRSLAAVLMLAIGFTAGTMAPRAAADATDKIAAELRAIRGELTGIRRALEARR